MPSVIMDWKKWGAFIGLDYRLQVSAYAMMPFAYDKVNKRVWEKPKADYACVYWVGEKGVRQKLVLNRDELEEGFEQYKNNLKTYRFRKKYESDWMNKPRTYPNPNNPEEQFVSVTEVLKETLPKNALMNWNYDIGLEAGLRVYNSTSYDVTKLFKVRDKINDKTAEKEDREFWKGFTSEVHELGLSPYARRDKAGNIGTLIHKNIMFLLSHKDVDLTNAPDWLQTTVDNMMNWTMKNVQDVQLVEQTVFDPELEVAGTLDAQLVVDESVVKRKELLKDESS